MAFDIMNSIDPREVIKLPLDLIKPNKNNPYVKDEHLEKIIAIKASILDEGLNNPIVIEDTENGYVINKGHSRYYAYQLINQEQITGYEEIECYVVHFDDEATSLRSLMRDNATQKERTVQDKCREVKLYLEKIIPVIRDYPENKGIPTKQLIANDLGMSATTVQNLMSVIKNDNRITEMFLDKKINLQGAYLMATSSHKDELVGMVENKSVIGEEIPSKVIKKKINEIEKRKDKPKENKEIKEKNENHLILLKNNLLSVTHDKGNNPLKTEFVMYSGSKLTIECYEKLGRINFLWQVNGECYRKFNNTASCINVENAILMMQKISRTTYIFMINEIINDCYLRSESKYKDLEALVDKSIEIVNLLQKKGIRSDL
ncbi:MAG: ParB/RepB/Spo0J family partition protein [Thomasclavelia ramosa]